MSIADSILPEFDLEMQATRVVLARVPDDRLAWKPHEKSMTLVQLAGHVARLPRWADVTLREDGLDLGSPEAQQQPDPPESTEEILAIFDESSAGARETIASADDAVFGQPWSLAYDGAVLFTAPKAAVLRRFVMNHLIHHRGQLTVFLRLNDVPVPQTFGPTADEPEFGGG
ncbi:MAG: DinB family protein [Gemmatimonadota bacterium]